MAHVSVNFTPNLPGFFSPSPSPEYWLTYRFRCIDEVFSLDRMVPPHITFNRYTCPPYCLIAFNTIHNFCLRHNHPLRRLPKGFRLLQSTNLLTRLSPNFGSPLRRLVSVSFLDTRFQFTLGSVLSTSHVLTI